MSPKPFHLGWFYSKGFGPKAWKQRWAGSAVPRFTKPDLPVDLALAMERAGFDYLMIEDSSNVPYTFQGSHDAYLRHCVDTPKLDPMVLAPFLAAATERLGIVVTCSTTEYHPSLLAGAMNALAHVSGGRIGWNVVTGSNDGGAQNYGRDRQYPHDERYDRADEFMQLAGSLWDSPQGSPVIAQAGGSGRGKAFASRWAETVIAIAHSAEQMKAYRDDVRAQAVAAGRDPDGVKVLFLASPVIDESTEAALERSRAGKVFDQNEMETQLAGLSRSSGIDFSTFDLDEPLPELWSNGHQSMVAAMKGFTLNEWTHRNELLGGNELFVGTARDVAGRMHEAMEEAGGDGYLIANSFFSRRYVMEICDGLVPELQKRGVTRTQYEFDTFRENLMAF